uniref:SET domain-containing protein n=1 Tax=Globodera pallida TaxID=36090 RepID=A0A183C1H2_GLOPA
MTNQIDDYIESYGCPDKKLTQQQLAAIDEEKNDENGLVMILSFIEHFKKDDENLKKENAKMKLLELVGVANVINIEEQFPEVMRIGSLFYERRRKEVIDWIYALQLPQIDDCKNSKSLTNLSLTDSSSRRCGGFRGSILSSSADLCPYDSAHLAQTYTSLCILLILGDDLSRLDRRAVLNGVAKAQGENGRFFWKCRPRISNIKNELLEQKVAAIDLKLDELKHSFELSCWEGQEITMDGTFLSGKFSKQNCPITKSCFSATYTALHGQIMLRRFGCADDGNCPAFVDISGIEGLAKRVNCNLCDKSSCNIPESPTNLVTQRGEIKCVSKITAKIAEHSFLNPKMESFLAFQLPPKSLQCTEHSSKCVSVKCAPKVSQRCAFAETTKEALTAFCSTLFGLDDWQLNSFKLEEGTKV